MKANWPIGRHFSSQKASKLGSLISVFGDLSKWFLWPTVMHWAGFSSKKKKFISVHMMVAPDKISGTY